MARIITFSQLLISITITYVDSSTDCTKLLTSVRAEEESFSEMWLFMIWISDETFNENFNPGWDLKWFSGTNDFITPAQISLPLQFSIFVWSSIVLLTNILLSEGCFVSANKLCSLSKSSSFNLSEFWNVCLGIRKVFKIFERHHLFWRPLPLNKGDLQVYKKESADYLFCFLGHPARLLHKHTANFQHPVQ